MNNLKTLAENLNLTAMRPTPEGLDFKNIIPTINEMINVINELREEVNGYKKLLQESQKSIGKLKERSVEHTQAIAEIDSKAVGREELVARLDEEFRKLANTL